MRVVALISGGKDSCYNMMQCISESHDIVALANLQPKDKDELDSYMYQTVGHSAIGLYAEAMSVPLYRRTIQGTSTEIGKDYTPNPQDEVEDLYELLKEVKDKESIEGVSVGAILSDYQRVRVENVCRRLQLTSLAYLWRRDQKELMKEMINCHVESIIIKVAALGLDPSKHLGKTLQEIYPHMIKMEQEFGLHICGEGGEFESFTLDCPLFQKKIIVDETETVVHSEDAFAPVAYLNLKTLHLQEKPPTGLTDRETLKTLPMMTGENLLDELFTDDEKLHLFENPPEIIPDMDPPIIPPLTEAVLVQTGVYKDWFHIGCLALSNCETIEDTTIKTMDKLKDTVHYLGKEMKDLVSVCLFVRKLSEFKRINSIYEKYFAVNPPVRVCIQGSLPANVDLILDCTGHILNETSGTKCTMHVQSISHWASANIGPYSQAVHVNGKMFVAGQIPLCPSSMNIITGGLLAQARLSIRHVERVIAAMRQGSRLDHVTNAVCFVTSKHFIASARNEWQRALDSKQIKLYCEEGVRHKPLLSFVIVAGLPREAMLEWHVQILTDEAALTDSSKEQKLADGTEITLDYSYNVESSIFYSRSHISLGSTEIERVYSAMVSWMNLQYGVLERLSLPLPSLEIARVFFPASLISYTDFYTVMQRVKELPFPMPVISLVPVSELIQENTILCIC